MVEATRVAGNIIKLAAKVSFCTQQGTFTKGLGLITKLMDLEFTLLKMVHVMRVTGEMIIRMAKVLKSL